MRAGHSLGAAVAVLSTLRLLRQLPEGADPAVACLTFACPAVGNAALFEEVNQRGWQRFFKNFLIPGKLHCAWGGQSACAPDEPVCGPYAALCCCWRCGPG